MGQIISVVFDQRNCAVPDTGERSVKISFNAEDASVTLSNKTPADQTNDPYQWGLDETTAASTPVCEGTATLFITKTGKEKETAASLYLIDETGENQPIGAIKAYDMAMISTEAFLHVSSEQENPDFGDLSTIQEISTKAQEIFTKRMLDYTKKALGDTISATDDFYTTLSTKIDRALASEIMMLTFSIRRQLDNNGDGVKIKLTQSAPKPGLNS